MSGCGDQGVSHLSQSECCRLAPAPPTTQKGKSGYWKWIDELMDRMWTVRIPTGKEKQIGKKNIKSKQFLCVLRQFFQDKFLKINMVMEPEDIMSEEAVV